MLGGSENRRMEKGKLKIWRGGAASSSSCGLGLDKEIHAVFAGALLTCWRLTKEGGLDLFEMFDFDFCFELDCRGGREGGREGGKSQCYSHG